MSNFDANENNKRNLDDKKIDLENSLNNVAGGRGGHHRRQKQPSIFLGHTTVKRRFSDIKYSVNGTDVASEAGDADTVSEK